MVDTPRSSRTDQAHPDRRPAAVAGASSGIGAAIAAELARAGSPVAVGARRLERCEQVSAEIVADGGEAFAHVLDVCDAASVSAFAAASAGALGEIEILVINAGGMRPGRLWETSTEEFAADLETNVIGGHRLISAFLPGMLERKRGDIVVISSDVVPQPRPGLGGYVSGKWGLEGMARVLQMELEGTGIRTSIVRPGPTVTEIAAGWDMDAAVQVVDAAKRWGLIRHWGVLRPDAIARTVAHVVTAPRGVHIGIVDVSPEAPPS